MFCCTAYCRVGLGTLLADGRVLACHADRWQARYFSEVGSAHVLLQAGFNIDCLMIRWGFGFGVWSVGAGLTHSLTASWARV